MAAKLTDNMKHVLGKVARATIEPGTWYEAANHGERVTLAALSNRGYLEREARRGSEGEADAAYKYRIAEAVRAEMMRRRSARICQHCGTSAYDVANGDAGRACSRVPGSFGLLGSHSYVDVKAVA